MVVPAKYKIMKEQVHALVGIIWHLPGKITLGVFNIFLDDILS